MAHLFGEGLLDRFRQLGAAWFRVNAVVGAVGMAGVVALNEQFVTLWVGREWFAGHAVSILYALWALLSLVGAAAYDQMYSLGEFGRICRVVWVEAVLRLALIVPGMLLLGAWTVPAGSCVSQFLAMNWWLTAALWRTLQPAPRQRRAVVSGAVRHALVAAVVAAPLLIVRPQIAGWTAFATWATGVALAAGALSALIDPELRRMVRTRGLYQ
jgi:O-antigen/teichoic acid export membrane protein